MIFRASGLHNLMATNNDKSGLGLTALAYIRSVYRENELGFRSFDGNKYTHKGNMMEDAAIAASAELDNEFYVKNTERKTINGLTGECDILAADYGIDTKCSWDGNTHPFFAIEASDKIKKSGYDIQAQAYMHLFERDVWHVDFWLLPTPVELLGSFDDREMHIDKVLAIPEHKRRTRVTISRDDALIDKMLQHVKMAQDYYATLKTELENTK